MWRSDHFICQGYCHHQKYYHPIKMSRVKFDTIVRTIYIQMVPFEKNANTRPVANIPSLTFKWWCVLRPQQTVMWCEYCKYEFQCYLNGPLAAAAVSSDGCCCCCCSPATTRDSQSYPFDWPVLCNSPFINCNSPNDIGCHIIVVILLLIFWATYKMLFFYMWRSNHFIC